MGLATRLASHQNNSGFTLIEVMVSIIILMVGMLGLLVAIDAASVQVLKDSLRTEAVQVAENRISTMKLLPYDSISSTAAPGIYYYPPETVASRLRGSSKSYTVRRSTSEYHPGSSQVSKELRVRVSWLLKNVSTSHEVRTIITK